MSYSCHGPYIRKGLTHFMDYENYKLEDFLADEEFKRWVINPDKESEIFWNNWLASHPDQKPTILEAREIVISLDFQMLEPTEEDHDQVLFNILKGSNAKHVSASKRLYSLKYKTTLLRMAGIFLVLLVTGAIYYNYRINSQQASSLEKIITKANPRGQKSQITLPDGTVLWLNSESKIKYSSSFGEKDRQLELQGEAFFEVAENKEKPFTVHVNEIQVVALGTSFNINAFPENRSVTVALVTGKVLVKETLSLKNKKKPHFQDVVLIPGERLSYDLINFSIEKSYYELKSAFPWKDGTIIFNNASFEEVKTTLERWFNVNISVTENIKRDWNFSGEFQRESLERILEHIGFIEDFKFSKEGNDITITYTN